MPDLTLSAPAPAPSPFRVLATLSVVLIGLALLWSVGEIRMVDGAPVWMKPLKFALSFAVLFGTIALVEDRLSPRVRDGWPLRIVAWVMAAAFLAEMAYMIYQGARGEASHFNFSTPFHTFMYTVVMAAGAVSLVASVGVIGWIVKRDRDADLSPVLREAIWLGFGLSFVLTMIVAGYMSNSGGHFTGLHPEGAPTLPLMGWSGVTGDLRPAHFLSLHAMQVLPLLALWLGSRPGGVRVVRIAAVGYAALTLAVFGQALLGLPLIPLG
ncbi:hypothetical protein HKCCE3408_02265 [Rhodobacterales bacterium HKCCE3408]|nr:hypothetical protein [Rhodobacterales bacterium HKCCE3408]